MSNELHAFEEIGAYVKTDSNGRLRLSNNPDATLISFFKGSTGRYQSITTDGELAISPDSDLQGIIGASGSFVGIKDGHGGKLELKVDRQTVSFVGSGATVTVSNARLAKKRIEGVAGRVKTTLTGLGLTTFKIGDGSDADRYGATVAAAAGNTFDFSTSTANPGEWPTAAGNVVFTANAGVFQTGSVDLEVFYWDLVAPTGA